MPEPTLLEVRRAIATLQALAESRAHVDNLDPSVRIALSDAAKSALGPAPRIHRRARPRKPPVLVAATPKAMRVTCSICRTRFVVAVEGAPRVCPACRAQEDAQQSALAAIDLTGRVALVTGGRIRLGHRTALSLLRAGARVVVTSRFPHAARKRFEGAGLSAEQLARLDVFPLDLRKLDDVERFARSLDNRVPHLDIVVHNAAQTVKKPAEMYAPLALAEKAAAQLPAAAYASSTLTALSANVALDDEGEPVDTREQNSWTALMDDVDKDELVEVLVVNAAAPFVLTRALLPLLTKSPSPRRAVVCVSSREGRFHVEDKLARHPHTNMAKAALNMLVRTSGGHLAEAGISTMAVDPGWFSEQRAQRETRSLPLSLDDAAARVLSAVVRGLDASTPPIAGALFKDFKVAAW
jgi:NAD(P)-dependent dehydrogenase (short-subunit alcohol dehydrogenase family)